MPPEVSPSSSVLDLLPTIPYINHKVYVSKDELWSSDEGPLFSKREESLLIFPKKPVKLRMGGSRSNRLTSNQPPKSTSNSKGTGECFELTQITVDKKRESASNDSRSHPLGRGGGSRPCTDSKDPKNALRAAGKAQQGGSAVRTMGRGGLGSRPQPLPRNKSGSDKLQPENRLLARPHIWKASKRRSIGPELMRPDVLAQDSLEKDTKTNYHKRLSFLPTNFTLSATQKLRLRESISRPSLQSDGTSVASFDFPSYFSDQVSLSTLPSTVSFGMENEPISQDLTGDQKVAPSIRSTMSSCPSSPVEATYSHPKHSDKVTQPAIPIKQPQRGSLNRFRPNLLVIHACEAAALHTPKSTELAFVTPTRDKKGSFKKSRRHRQVSWTGQWNADLLDVIQALRELR